MPQLADQFVDSSPLHSGGAVQDHTLFVYTPIFWTSVVIFFGVALAIVYAALRFRRKADDEEPEQVHGNNRLELGWTIIPFLILITLFGVTAANMPFIANRPAGASVVRVLVVGHQFNWDYYYNRDDSDVARACTDPGSFGPLKAADPPAQLPRRPDASVSDPGLDKAPKIDIPDPNKLESIKTGLVVPTGVDIDLTVTSCDVNHSYYIPRLGGQINAIPGQINHTHFQAAKPDVFYGECTELCGTGHATMLNHVVAVSPDDFETFKKMKTAPPSTPAPGASSSSSQAGPASPGASPGGGAGGQTSTSASSSSSSAGG